MRKTLNVHIAEIHVAKNGEILKSILGSCVGIGFIWKSRSLCGLAHCLLPQSPARNFEIGARYVDQAIPSLIALMKIKPHDFSEIEILVAGGGNMTCPNTLRAEELVGSYNLKTALLELDKLGLKPTLLEKGGNEGRRVIIDSKDCSYRVERIPRIVSAG